MKMIKGINKISEKHLKRKLNDKEILFSFYVYYMLSNLRTIDIDYISYAERKILNKWVKEKYFKKDNLSFVITKKFWLFISELFLELRIKPTDKNTFRSNMFY